MKVKVTSYGKCSMFVLGLDMNCPLCKTLIKSGESHKCSQPNKKELMPKSRNKLARKSSQQSI